MSLFPGQSALGCCLKALLAIILSPALIMLYVMYAIVIVRREEAIRRFLRLQASPSSSTLSDPLLADPPPADTNS